MAHNDTIAAAISQEKCIAGLTTDLFTLEEVKIANTVEQTERLLHWSEILSQKTFPWKFDGIC